MYAIRSYYDIFMSEKSTLLSYRLAEILNKLSTGAIVNVKELANEFSVSERTIQKDLNERLDPKMIEILGNGNYKLISGYLGNITTQDIISFSELSGIIDLYPDIDSVLKAKIRDSLIVKPIVNSACIPNSKVFTEINNTIINKLKIRFEYNDKNLIMEPYKLLNYMGIWYLIAKESKNVKTYCVHRMKKVRRDFNSFEIDYTLLKEIENNPSPWFRKDKIQVELKITSGFSEYFLDRMLIENCEKVISNDDGSLTVIKEVYSLDEIKGVIKFWLPNIKVRNNFV